MLSTYLARATGSGDDSDAWVMLSSDWRQNQDRKRYDAFWAPMYFAETVGTPIQERAFNQFTQTVRVYAKGTVDPLAGSIYTFQETFTLVDTSDGIEISHEQEQVRGQADPVDLTFPRFALSAKVDVRELPRNSSAPTMRPGFEDQVGGALTGLCSLDISSLSPTERPVDAGRWLRVPQGWIPMAAVAGLHPNAELPTCDDAVVQR